MKPAPIKRAEAEIVLCKSNETGKLYYSIMENGMPLKYWAFDDMSEAARDFIGELINAFDLGYDLRCQFPVIKDGQKVLVPKATRMFNEPGGTHKNTNVEEKFFQKTESAKPTTEENIIK